LIGMGRATRPLPRRSQNGETTVSSAGSEKSRFSNLVLSGVIGVTIVCLMFLGPPAFARVGPRGVRSTGPESSTNFIYRELRRQTPFTYDSSYVGLFHVQYNYANSTMQWGFGIAKQWQTEAGPNPVEFEYHIYTRGKEVNNYGPHFEPASYLFHSSIGSSFQFKGDAPWTYHSLRIGDTVDIISKFTYTVPGILQHDFWANYRIGIR
jgi:hypothetical protein